jgi:hypothetical protein
MSVCDNLGLKELIHSKVTDIAHLIQSETKIDLSIDMLELMQELDELVAEAFVTEG